MQHIWNTVGHVTPTSSLHDRREQQRFTGIMGKHPLHAKEDKTGVFTLQRSQNQDVRLQLNVILINLMSKSVVHSSVLLFLSLTFP